MNPSNNTDSKIGAHAFLTHSRGRAGPRILTFLYRTTASTNEMTFRERQKSFSFTAHPEHLTSTPDRARTHARVEGARERLLTRVSLQR